MWIVLAFVVLLSPVTVKAQLALTALEDITLATDALLMPSSAPYGRAINGVSFQTDNVITIGDYQYSTWYRAAGTFSEDLMLARRDLGTGVIEVMDTGRNLVNGDSSAGDGSSSWDAHNVISLGVSTGDQRLHLSYDHHNSELNYSPLVVGSAGGAVWDNSMVEPQRPSLNNGGPAIDDLTYPRYVTSPEGGLVMTYRTGGSGNGNLHFATYDHTTGLWNTPHEIINGSSGDPYTDPVNTSFNRNAYLNGVSYDTSGNLHITWTWRESAGGSNHDIMYAWSDDGGDTWRNNAGSVIGSVGSPIDLTSPDVTVVSMDRTNSLMNQQAQAVDPDGGVHVVMWHKQDAAPPQTNPPFTTANAAYYHYYRDPNTGVWSRNELPTSREVGQRPDMAYDVQGNLYVAYLSPGPGDGVGVLDYYSDGDLIIAGATKASGFTDWSILHTDTRDFATEPFIDQNRLLQDGVLSVFVQENDDFNTGRTGTPLHLIEYTPTSILTWIGGDTGVWSTGASTDWDSTGDALGNASFLDGYAARFDDNGSPTNGATRGVTVSGAVAPVSTTFANGPGADYAISGGGISGSGSLRVSGGGVVILGNGANTYSGDTLVEAGELSLQGASITMSPYIRVEQDAALSADLNPGGLALIGQHLSLAGDVAGAVSSSGSSLVSGDGTITGSLHATGGIVRVGGAGMPIAPTTVSTLIDDFSDGDLAEYTATKILDQGATNNIAYSISSESLGSVSTGADGAEQTLLYRNDGVTLGVGQELIVDGPFSESDANDLGLSVGEAPTNLIGAGDTRSDADYFFISFRGSTHLNSRGFNGNSEISQVQLSGVSADQLFIARPSESVVELGWYDGSIRNVLRSEIVASSDVFDHVGFYTDLRSDGAFAAGLDNLRIDTPGILSVIGERLTINGDYTQGVEATLELDIFSPDATDRLVVSGAFAAGGTLSVLLDDNAPSPGAGDTFDVLDFTSLSGVFDAAELPTLDPGLVWDTSLLGTTGELIVAQGIPGDFNGDGAVDAADYTVWRDSEGDTGFGLAADANHDFRVSQLDYAIWVQYFGATLESMSATVPEPSGVTLLAWLVAAAGSSWRSAR